MERSSRMEGTVSDSAGITSGHFRTSFQAQILRVLGSQIRVRKRLVRGTECVTLGAVDNVALDWRVCSRARLSRDPRFDGKFFIGVRGSGVYCRPICPAPTAKEKNVRYFLTAAAASRPDSDHACVAGPNVRPGRLHGWAPRIQLLARYGSSVKMGCRKAGLNFSPNDWALALAICGGCSSSTWELRPVRLRRRAGCTLPRS